MDRESSTCTTSGFSKSVVGPGGEFLNLLCTLSNSVGVGIDPIADPRNGGTK
jgi:hypothetical protein